MNHFRFILPTEVIFGVDSIEQIGEIGNRYGKKALIVMGGNSARKSGLLDRVVGILKDKGIESAIFDKVTPNPTTEVIRGGVALAKEEKVDFIIGLGGGSAMDASKAIAFMSVSKGDILDYFPGEKYFEEGPQGALPLITVTTTSGTGSEANQVAVVTDTEGNRKCGLRTKDGYPTVAIIDPKLTVSVPPRITAATGLDVLYHALEAYVSKKASPYTDLLAIEAMGLVSKSLAKAVKDGADIEARADMSLANTFAGMAIDHGGTVAIHATSHPVSAYYDSPHGEALSAVAPTYLKHYYRTDIPKFAKIAELLGCQEAGLTQEQKAEKASEYLIKLLEEVDLRITLSDLGVTEDMIDTLTKNSFETMKGAIGNTKGTLEYDEMYQLYKESL
ncbi:alcohol dehydrogenase [Natranaerovirga hydrolytica]|uniref:Alcohol dehydrogenase n=1 Tax=Natranaerovirga hydrolytica TaxID=680378 RepID=A0A4R1MIJ8_9FIRM|nr:iron-containing alcohol dehydrogenase [Natranaerovirga hydrolytica]TCK92466.1 alcohol dehydrogenase [Natranaerovirga hydrolytica]